MMNNVENNLELLLDSNLKSIEYITLILNKLAPHEDLVYSSIANYEQDLTKLLQERIELQSKSRRYMNAC